jgi:tRNA(Ile)-lysidine synthase
MSDKMSSTLIAALAADWPPEDWCDVTALVAVSGGADSTALARGLSQLRVTGEGRLVIAHFNHALRGAESDADQAFVEHLARELGCDCVVGKQEGERGRAGEGESSKSEESLRNQRYAFLAKTADRIGARYVATAHTADDQVETVLMNILRGTGLAGVAGIPRVRQLTEASTLVRPLLGVTRAEVLAYLSLLGKPYREDASNASTAYTRNRIRHELLPLLARDYNPQVYASIRRLSQLVGEADDLVDTAARRLLSNIRRLIPNGVELQARPLRQGPELVARAALKLAWKWQGWPLADMSFDRWDELLAFVRQPSLGDAITAAPRMFPGGIRAEKTDGVLRLTGSTP